MGKGSLRRGNRGMYSRGSLGMIRSVGMGSMCGRMGMSISAILKMI